MIRMFCSFWFLCQVWGEGSSYIRFFNIRMLKKLRCFLPFLLFAFSEVQVTGIVPLILLFCMAGGLPFPPVLIFLYYRRIFAPPILK